MISSVIILYDHTTSNFEKYVLCHHIFQASQSNKARKKDMLNSNVKYCSIADKHYPW